MQRPGCEGYDGQSGGEKHSERGDGGNGLKLLEYWLPCSHQEDRHQEFRRPRTAFAGWPCQTAATRHSTAPVSAAYRCCLCKFNKPMRCWGEFGIESGQEIASNWILEIFLPAFVRRGGR